MDNPLLLQEQQKQQLDLNTLNPDELMDLYNDPDYIDKTSVFNVLRKKFPDFAEKYFRRQSREYYKMAEVMSSPIAAALSTLIYPFRKYVEDRRARARALATETRRASDVGGKTRRNRRSLKQRKRKHSRRRR